METDAKMAVLSMTVFNERLRAGPAIRPAPAGAASRLERRADSHARPRHRRQCFHLQRGLQRAAAPAAVPRAGQTRDAVGGRPKARRSTGGSLLPRSYRVAAPQPHLRRLRGALFGESRHRAHRRRSSAAGGRHAGLRRLLHPAGKPRAIWAARQPPPTWGRALPRLSSAIASGNRATPPTRASSDAVSWPTTIPAPLSL